jgi:hypothetical protein
MGRTIKAKLKIIKNIFTPESQTGLLRIQSESQCHILNGDNTKRIVNNNVHME